MNNKNILTCLWVFIIIICIGMMVYLYHAHKALNIEYKMPMHKLSDYEPLIIAKYFPGEELENDISKL